MTGRKLALVLTAMAAAWVSSSAGATCPLPEDGTLQLEWVAVQEGWHESVVEVIGAQEGEVGVWNDALYDESGRLLWAGVLRCRGSEVVLSAEYEPDTGRARHFAPAVPWWGPATVADGESAGVTSGVTIVGADASPYTLAVLRGTNDEGQHYSAMQVEREDTEVLWSLDVWMEVDSEYPSARRIQWGEEPAIFMQRVGVSHPTTAAAVDLPPFDRSEAVATAARYVRGRKPTTR